jgi:hypothetical protein
MGASLSGEGREAHSSQAAKAPSNIFRKYGRRHEKISQIFKGSGQAAWWKPFSRNPAMPQQGQFGFSLLTSTALIVLAGSGAVLGALPGPSVASPPLALAALPLLGAACWLRRRRESHAARRLRDLRLTVTLATAPAGQSEAELAFQAAGPGHWRAWRGDWQVELRQGGGEIA